ncbi:hypothetical protein GCM10008957_36130 [Deinococcus ruber]|uniref:Uncharacterized protein n=1 Tax=Deinococcus ruber TaxID=1848197 RepID=A0A918FBZ0_9DEIO|nr:hypothetical protein GCM10008957_36130 [Deinococcus ruber]
MRLFALDVCHESDPAGVVFVAGVVQPVFGGVCTGLVSSLHSIAGGKIIVYGAAVFSTRLGVYSVRFWGILIRIDNLTLLILVLQVVLLHGVLR